MHLQRLRARTETERSCLLAEQVCDAFVADFGSGFANVADQKRHMVRHAWMVAAHVGVDRLQFVDKSIIQQKVQCAIDRWRCGVAAIILEPIEQIVSLDRFLRGSDQFQYLTADLSQAQPACVASGSDFAYKSAGIVGVVVMLNVGGSSDHGPMIALRAFPFSRRRSEVVVWFEKPRPFVARYRTINSGTCMRRFTLGDVWQRFRGQERPRNVDNAHRGHRLCACTPDRRVWPSPPACTAK